MQSSPSRMGAPSTAKYTLLTDDARANDVISREKVAVVFAHFAALPGAAGELPGARRAWYPRHRSFASSYLMSTDLSRCKYLAWQ